MTHFFTNKQVSDLIKDVAIAYEVNPKYRKESVNKYRVTKLNEIADIILRSEDTIYTYYKDNIPLNIKGIGKNTQQYLKELFDTGRVRHYEEVMSGLPKFLFVLARFMSPLKAHKIIETYKVKNLEEAQQLFPEEIKIKPFLHLLPKMMKISDKFKNYIEQETYVTRSEVAGSIRRRKSAIKDIDIVVETKDVKKTREYILKYPDIKEIVNQGDNWLIVKITTELISVDVRIISKQSQEYITLLHHLTGSKTHNIKLREMAIKMNLRINEHGIYKKKDESVFHPKTEQEFFNYLKLPYIPPELREETGLELTEEIPKRLVENYDIKGDFHIHSSFKIQSSHDYGDSTIDQLAQAAVKLGYRYFGVSDHNPKQSLTEEEMLKLLKERKREIDAASKKHNIRIYNMLEVDIRPDGTLAVSDKVLDSLDFFIASIHSSFDLDIETMTDRIIRGLSHSKAKIFGHPTCRIIPDVRKEIKVNWEIIFKFCAQNNKYIEINAAPPRTDLPWNLIFEALNHRVKFVINSDTHLITQLNNMPFGVFNARKGWCSKEDIANTYDIFQ